MADEEQISATYDTIDGLWRAMLGDSPDITCAYYEGDYSLSLVEAQHRKHAFVIEQLGIQSGMRVLDIGCGWGPMMTQLERSKVRTIGLTLSRAQAAYCTSRGMDVRLLDWKNVNASELGEFDAIVSIGAFEHFCSVEELEAGLQDEIYRNFFQLCHQLLRDDGRMFLQTMTWGALGVPDHTTAGVHAEKRSVDWILGHLMTFYPGSWLPNGLDHITQTAEGKFGRVSASSGRLDYIQTMDEWGAAARRKWWRVLPIALSSLPRFVGDRDLRTQVMSMVHGCNQTCFKEQIMDHFRIVFQKHA